jgi:hypothetical protein
MLVFYGRLKLLSINISHRSLPFSPLMASQGDGAQMTFRQPMISPLFGRIGCGKVKL